MSRRNSTLAVNAAILLVTAMYALGGAWVFAKTLDVISQRNLDRTYEHHFERVCRNEWGHRRPCWRYHRDDI